MGLVNKTALKGYFNTGDRPSESTFVDVFDSVLGLHSDDDQTVAGATTFSDSVISPTVKTTTSLLLGDGTYTVPIKMKTVSLTLATDAATTDSADFFPEGCVPLSITIKVTTAISDGHHITQVGTSNDDDKYAETIANNKLDQVDDTLTFAPFTTPTAGNSDDGDTAFSSDGDLRLTTAGTPTAGVVLVAMIYIDGASLT
jgi:hypothetical protein